FHHVSGQARQFQSRTGSPGHLAPGAAHCSMWFRMVSIPNGLHRPFSLSNVDLLQLTENVSIPNGLHRPFSLPDGSWESINLVVSIPNGLHRPFSQATKALAEYRGKSSFNPERAPQAI